jgi:hypothetical protein
MLPNSIPTVLVRKRSGRRKVVSLPPKGDAGLPSLWGLALNKTLPAPWQPRRAPAKT